MSKTLESTGAHYSPAAWRDEEGGWVGNSIWRDEYGMSTESRCGHKHRNEADAEPCMLALLDGHGRGEHAEFNPRCGYCDNDLQARISTPSPSSRMDSAEVMAWLKGAQARRDNQLRPDSRADITGRLQRLEQEPT